MSDSSRPHRLQPTRLFCPWDFPGKSTGVGCHCFSQSVSQFSRSVMSDSLGPHESQQPRPPCPSPTPGVHSDSCPMAPHSSSLAWKIPWAEEPGRLQSMGSLRVGHDSVISLSLFTFMHRRRKWQPTPVFLPGESQGWGNLMGCRLWGRTESDMTEAT